MPWAKYLVQYRKTDRRVANRQITINTSTFLLRKKYRATNMYFNRRRH